MAEAVQEFSERIVGAKLHSSLPSELEQGIKNYTGSDKDEGNI